MLCKGGDDDKNNSLCMHKYASDSTSFYVYRFLDKDDNILYVGKTKRLRYRMYQHLSKASNVKPECIDKIDKIQYIEFTNECDMCIMEIYLINYYKPEYNVDSKSSVGSIKIPIPSRWISYNQNTWNEEVKKDTQINNKQEISFELRFRQELFGNEKLTEFLDNRSNNYISEAELDYIKELCRYNGNNIDELNDLLLYNNSKISLEYKDNMLFLAKHKCGKHGYGCFTHRPNGTYEFSFIDVSQRRIKIYGKTKSELSTKIAIFLAGTVK